MTMLPLPPCPACGAKLTDDANSEDKRVVLRCSNANCLKEWRPRLEDAAEDGLELPVAQGPRVIDKATARYLLPHDHIRLVKAESKARLINSDLKRLTTELKLATMELSALGDELAEAYQTSIDRIKHDSGLIIRPVSHLAAAQASLQQAIRDGEVMPQLPPPPPEE